MVWEGWGCEVSPYPDPFRSLGYLSFRFLPLVVLPETLSLLRFAWLADWVAICQPGFYWRLKAYSYLRSCEGAYS